MWHWLTGLAYRYGSRVGLLQLPLMENEMNEANVATNPAASSKLNDNKLKIAATNN